MIRTFNLPVACGKRTGTHLHEFDLYQYGNSLYIAIDTVALNELCHATRKEQPDAESVELTHCIAVSIDTGEVLRSLPDTVIRNMKATLDMRTLSVTVEVLARAFTLSNSDLYQKLPTPQEALAALMQEAYREGVRVFQFPNSDRTMTLWQVAAALSLSSPAE